MEVSDARGEGGEERGDGGQAVAARLVVGVARGVPIVPEHGRHLVAS